jgi:hypothetical protein
MATRLKNYGSGKDTTQEDHTKHNKKGEKDQKRIEKKDRQKELTENIALSYQTIRPTIIQAQRVLKILDTLKTKFLVTQSLNFEFLRHFENQETLQNSKLDISLVQKLSKSTLDTLSKLAVLQRKMYELMEQEIPQESQTGEEEQDDDSRRNDDHDDEDNQEAKERRAKEEAEKERIRKEREGQVLTLKNKMQGDYNNLVRQLERDQNEYAIIKVSFILA